jgi:hypothetical protein
MNRVTPRTARTPSRFAPKLLSEFHIWFIFLAMGCLLPAAHPQSPPPDLPRQVAQRELETEQERQNYTYRQTVVIEELDGHGIRAGEYREVRDIIFSPQGDRTEKIIGSPFRSLKRLVLTEEDFRDLREVQPVLFTLDQLWIYETRFRGEEKVGDVDCWVLQIRPRQILAGQRLFDGLFWVSKSDCSIVKSEGQAVPQIRLTKSENLFPRFTTLRSPVDGKHWFPLQTYGDDTLGFRTGPQRIRLTIRYANYRRFSAESTIRFQDQK